MRYFLLALPLVLATAAPAQTATSHDIGFIASFANKSVGTCAEFSCVPRTLEVNPDNASTLLLNVFGGNDMPFLVAASIKPARCVSLPGLANSFALDPATTVLVAVGTLNNSTNICGRAKGTVSIPVPSKVREGATVAFQALSISAVAEALPAFSRPILVTARFTTTN